MQQLVEKTLEVLKAVERGGRIRSLEDLFDLAHVAHWREDAEWLLYHLELTGDVACGETSYMLTRRGEEHLELLRSILAPPATEVETLCESVEYLLETRYPEVFRRTV